MRLGTNRGLWLGLACSWLALSAFAFKGAPLPDRSPVRGQPSSSTTRVEKVFRKASEKQQAARAAAQREGLAVVWHGPWETPRLVRGGNLLQTEAVSSGKVRNKKPRTSPRDRAVDVLEGLSDLFAIKDAEQEFSERLATTDKTGHQHVRLTQQYQGLRVFGAELVVHFDPSGTPYQVNGEYVPEINVATVPSLSEKQAVRIAHETLRIKQGLTAEGNLQRMPELVVFAFRAEPTLAYTFKVLIKNQKGGHEEWLFWIDAATGDVLLSYNDQKKIAPPSTDGVPVTIIGQMLAREGNPNPSVLGWRENTGAYYLYSPAWKWYIYNLALSGYPDAYTYAFRMTNDWSSTDPVEMSLAVNFDSTQKYFKNVHNRNSYDNNGALARANAHDNSEGRVQAFWSPSRNYFSFGDGDNVSAAPLGVLDIVGHEFAHAVTEYSSQLVYAYESGALNESFSDIIASCVEFYAQPDGRMYYPGSMPGTADWLCGEDAWLKTTALRDLRNPKNAETVGAGNEQPSRYQGDFWYFGEDDYGGVHNNCSPHSFFFYLLSDGGVGTNELYAYDVAGIGVQNAEKLAYHVFAHLCTSATDYAAIGQYWITAALDLNPAWLPSVVRAWSAMMGAEPLRILTQSPLPNGRVGNPYQIQFAASGGMIPMYTWDLAEGQLPQNFTFSTNGVLSGFPVEPSTNIFKVALTCIDTQSVTNTFALVILPAYTAPFSEGFNGAMESPLSGWMQESVSNNVLWRTRMGSPTSRPLRAFEGEKNAYLGVFNDNGSESLPRHITRLISPVIQFGPAARDVRVSFAYFLEDRLFQPQDMLKIFYKTAWSNAWIGPLAIYTTTGSSWVQQSITLPESATGKGVYFAFEGHALGGHGVSLDAITIDDPVPPLQIITPSPLPIALCETNYTLIPLVTLASVGGFTNGVGLTNYSYAVVNGTSLPSGFTLTPQGAIIGQWNTPIALTSFDVQVTDLIGGGKATNTLAFAVEYPRAPVLQENFVVNNMLPEGWTMEYVANTVNWTIGTVGGKDGMSPPETAHSDLQYAFFFGTPGIGTTMATKLVSPVFDLTQMPNNTRLVFWHFMQRWGGQDELRVYSRNVVDGPWTRLASFTSNVTSWTQRIVQLPSPTRTYQIAFEGLAKSGYGVCVDTVSITDDGGAPVILTRDVLPSGFDNVSYRTRLEAVGGILDYRWAVVSNALPRGLSLDPDTGIISGIPAGSTQTVIRVSVTGQDNKASTNTFSLKILPPGLVPYLEPFAGTTLPEDWTQAPLPGSYAQWKIATGTYSTVYTSLRSPTTAYSNSLPRNVCLWSFNGPEFAELITKPFDLGGCENTRASFQLCMSANGLQQDALEVYYQTREGGAWTRLALYETNITRWTEQTLTLPNPSATYRLKFVGIAMGGWGICIDDLAVLGERTAPPLEITTPTPLPDGTNLVVYPGVMLTATGGTALPYTWRVVTSDIFPPGLTLNSETGVISGEPTQYGLYTFGVTVQDANNVTATSNFTLRVWSSGLSPYEEWKLRYFPLPAIYLGDDADQSGDGIPNLIKYGMGLSPTNQNLGIYILGGLTNLVGAGSVADGRYLYLGYRRSLAATDLNYIVKGTTSLTNAPASWSTNNIVELMPWIVGETDVWSWVFNVHTTPATNAPQRFLRLAVELQP